MLTAALAVLCLLLAIAAAVFALLWRAGSLHIADQARLLRHQLERIDGYRAELDALSIACTTARRRAAALTPDAEPPLPPWWLDDLRNLPTTHEREYRR